MTADAWIGTSGYDYDHFEGVVYPDDLPRTERLGCYAERFNALEVNNTFYGLPDEERVRRWREAFDEHHDGEYRFFFKGSRYVTHTKFLKEPRREPLRRLFEPSEEAGNRLAGFLWQFPSGWTCDVPEDVDRLRGFLGDLVDVSEPRWRHVVEMRHASWFRDDVFGILDEHDVAVAHADMPLQVLAPGTGARDIPREAVHAPFTADFVYLRKHGPEGGFGGEYGAGMTRTDAKHVKEWVDEGRDVYVFYNNDPHGHAARDAERLARQVGAE